MSYFLAIKLYDYTILTCLLIIMIGILTNRLEQGQKLREGCLTQIAVTMIWFTLGCVRIEMLHSDFYGYLYLVDYIMIGIVMSSGVVLQMQLLTSFCVLSSWLTPEILQRLQIICHVLCITCAFPFFFPQYYIHTDTQPHWHLIMEIGFHFTFSTYCAGYEISHGILMIYLLGVLQKRKSMADEAIKSTLSESWLQHTRTQRTYMRILRLTSFCLMIGDLVFQILYVLSRVFPDMRFVLFEVSTSWIGMHTCVVLVTNTLLKYIQFPRSQKVKQQVEIPKLLIQSPQLKGPMQSPVGFRVPMPSPTVSPFRRPMPSPVGSPFQYVTSPKAPMQSPIPSPLQMNADTVLVNNPGTPIFSQTSNHQENHTMFR